VGRHCGHGLLYALAVELPSHVPLPRLYHGSLCRVQMLFGHRVFILCLARCSANGEAASANSPSDALFAWQQSIRDTLGKQVPGVFVSWQWPPVEHLE
jgi:hypothetical protein